MKNRFRVAFCRKYMTFLNKPVSQLKKIINLSIINNTLAPILIEYGLAATFYVNNTQSPMTKPDSIPKKKA
jgi:hypothetical protein